MTPRSRGGGRRADRAAHAPGPRRSPTAGYQCAPDSDPRDSTRFLRGAPAGCACSDSTSCGTPPSMTQRSRIMGIGMAVPSRVVTNHDLAKLFETSHEWIVERTGIEERRWVEPGEGGAELGVRAAKEALERAGLQASDIDLIIYATLSPDVNFPGTGVFV